MLRRPKGTTVASIMAATGWQQHSARGFLACPFRKSYPDVLVMQPRQDRNGDNGARSLDGPMQGRIFL